jgi:hypothetical protein
MNTIKEKKLALNQQSLVLERRLRMDSGLVKRKLKNMGLWALMLGAGVMVTFFLFNKFFSKNKKQAKLNVEIDGEGNVKHTPELRTYESGNLLYGMIREQMTLFLLAILKQKLSEYIQTIDYKGVFEKVKSFIKQTTASTQSQ